VNAWLIRVLCRLVAVEASATQNFNVYDDLNDLGWPTSPVLNACTSTIFAFHSEIHCGEGSNTSFILFLLSHVALAQLYYLHGLASFKSLFVSS
jgi:hypothetical protein